MRMYNSWISKLMQEDINLHQIKQKMIRNQKWYILNLKVSTRKVNLKKHKSLRRKDGYKKKTKRSWKNPLRSISNQWFRCHWYQSLHPSPVLHETMKVSKPQRTKFGMFLVRYKLKCVRLRFIIFSQSQSNKSELHSTISCNSLIQISRLDN